MRNLVGISLLTVLCVSISRAGVINVPSCTNADVQNAITAAAAGDTVTVPAGNCTWSSVSINKPLTLQGAGTGQTNISFTGDADLTLTKQSSGLIRLQGFSFSASGGGSMARPIHIDGAWSAQPIIVQNNSFFQDNNGMFHITVPGGLIYTHNSSKGGVNDGPFTVKSMDSSSWTTADSLGSHDTNGMKNHYIEDSTFYGHSNGIIDCDDNCRVVIRHNTLSYGGYNSHGKDTSPYGTRHFEIYNNTWSYPESSSDLANVNWVIWVRGGTGVIFNNSISNVIGQTWGDKSEIIMSIRGAEDARPQGTCAQVSYPVPNQLGQNHNGTNFFTDPIYIWGNTGTFAIADGWTWGNPCGFNWSTFFQWGRDGVKSGNAKPGYAPYTYPHPLVGTKITPTLAAPKNLRLVL